MVFVWKHTRPRKLKQPVLFWLVFQWYLYEIVLDHANRSNLFNFEPFLKGCSMKSDYRPRKSKQPFQFWLVLEYFLHEILLDHRNRSNLFNFDSFLNGFCMKSYQTMQIEATCSNLTRFWMVFVWNPTRPEKSKQPVQIWPVSQWFLYAILLDHANRRKLYNFDPSLNDFCMKSYYTTQIQATFSILTRFWMLFVWNRFRPRKSMQPFQFWLVFIWFLYENLLDHTNWSNLFNFDPFLNGFCMKSYQTTQIEAVFSILTRFWVEFVWNRSRPLKSKQPFNFDPFFNGLFMKSYNRTEIEENFIILTSFWMFFYEILLDQANRSNLFNFELFLNGFCMKSY